VPRFIAILLPLMLAALARPAPAQPENAAGDTPASPPAAMDPLAARQNIVRDRLTQLEDRMFRLATELAESEPDHAARLRAAVERAREALLRQQLDETVRLLDANDWAAATNRQQKVLRDLEAVLDELLEDKTNTAAIEQRLAELQSLRDRLTALVNDQQQLADQTAPAERRPAPASPVTQNAQPTTAPASQPAPAASAETLAQSQRAIEARTRDLADAMHRDETTPAPGAAGVKNAAEPMQHAAGHLDQDERPQARDAQDQALEQLADAARQLDGAIRQLQQARQDELRRLLEARFREMLARQLEINAQTTTLAAIDADAWTRAQRLRAAALGDRERDLAALADDAKQRLAKDATTLVLPVLVQQLRDDLNAAADRLAAADAGPQTRDLQNAVVVTLQHLVSALQASNDAASAAPPQAAPQAGPNAPPGLLPPTAELRLLRDAQQAVRDRTEILHRRTDPDAPVTPEHQADLQRVAERQQQLAETARQIVNHLTGDRPK
jgi:hypothetical protein